jgi:prepilin-type N-terminal cleavage/methylation domain-containing protein
MNTFFLKNNRHSNVRSRAGFTLVEMMVSLAIFAVVAVVAIGALVKIIDANNKAQTLQAAMTNLSFALDTMSREMRVGTTYNCQNSTSATIPLPLSSNSCTTLLDSASGGTTGAMISFISSKVISTGAGSPCNAEISYRFRPDSLTPPKQWFMEKATQNICSAQIGNSDFSPIVDPSVVITGYDVQVSGDYFPLALVRITGYAGVREKEKSYFDVQTAVSTRSSP